MTKIICELCEEEYEINQCIKINKKLCCPGCYQEVEE